MTGPGHGVPATGTVRTYSDDHLSAAFGASPLAGLLATVASLPTVTAVEVFPDVAAKSFGVPTGVAVTTTGIAPACWNTRQASEVFADVAAAIGVTSPARWALGIDIDAILARGL